MKSIRWEAETRDQGGTVGDISSVKTKHLELNTIEMNFTKDEDVKDFEIFNISDTINVLAYSIMAIGKVY